VTTLGDSISLRIPVGKLHNDRYVPLMPPLPPLVQLIANYQKVRGPSRSGFLLERDDGQPFDRRTIHRYVDRVASEPGSVTSIPTSSATPWPPSSSTGE